jgi:hypothetical protein
MQARPIPAEQCLLHFRTTESVRLRTLFETLNPLLVEGILHADKKGISLQALNQVVLVDLILHASEIGEYHCDEEEMKNHLVGVSFERIYRCLKSCSQQDVVCMQLPAAGMNSSTPSLNIYILNESDGGDDDNSYCYAYAVRLLALEEEPCDVPDQEFETTVNLQASSFQRALRCAEKQGDYVQIFTEVIRPELNYIYFATNGDESSIITSLRFRTDPSEEEAKLMPPVEEKKEEKKEVVPVPASPFVAGMKPPKDIKTTSEPNQKSCMKKEIYCLRYLQLIAKATSMSSRVRVFLAPEYVLVLR